MVNLASVVGPLGLFAVYLKPLQDALTSVVNNVWTLDSRILILEQLS